MKLNSVIVGVLISLGTTIAGFGIISLLFEFMTSTGFMDDPAGSGNSRPRTIWLISICMNIIGIQVFRKRKTHATQRGISIMTVLAAFGWFFYYGKSLLFLE